MLELSDVCISQVKWMRNIVESLLLHLLAIVFTVFHRDMVVNVHSFLHECAVTLGILLWGKGQEEIGRGGKEGLPCVSSLSTTVAFTLWVRNFHYSLRLEKKKYKNDNWAHNPAETTWKRYQAKTAFITIYHLAFINFPLWPECHDDILDFQGLLSVQIQYLTAPRKIETFPFPSVQSPGKWTQVPLKMA